MSSGRPAAFFATIILCGPSFAHQPQIPDGNFVVVGQPEISKAYYAELKGAPAVYLISSPVAFNFYVNLLTPFGATLNPVSAKITRAETGALIAQLEGKDFEWREYFEPFGHDSYWMGPEFKIRAAPGNYKVTVYNPENRGKYALAIGEKEHFGPAEILNTMQLIPRIKREFFEKSPADFIFSPFALLFIVFVYSFAAMVRILLRFVIRKFAKSPALRASNNIGGTARFLRLLLAVALFLWAIFNSWNLLLLFFSGFLLVGAILGWSLTYALIGLTILKK